MGILATNLKPFEERMHYPELRADYFAHPENYRVEPFQIFGNLYFVGDRDACPYLIDTGDGLILIDTGYGHETHFLMENIRTLGFRVEDIKIIIHSHGHYDHFGGTETIKAISGATVYMSRVDTQLLREMPERALTLHSCVPGATIPWPDVEVEDGDHIRLGNTDIRCVLSPGHTFGTLSFFFDVSDGDETFRCGLHGGMGINTMAGWFLKKYGLSFDCRDQFLKAMDRLNEEKVDIFLGNHMQHNHTLERREKVLAGDKYAFVNKDEWQEFNEFCKQNLLNMLRK